MRPRSVYGMAIAFFGGIAMLPALAAERWPQGLERVLERVRENQPPAFALVGEGRAADIALLAEGELVRPPWEKPIRSSAVSRAPGS